MSDSLKADLRERVLVEAWRWAAGFLQNRFLEGPSRTRLSGTSNKKQEGRSESAPLAFLIKVFLAANAYEPKNNNQAQGYA